MSQSSDRQQRRDDARRTRVESEQAASAAAARKRRLAILGAVAAVVVVAVVAIALATGGGDSKAPPAEVQGVAATQEFIGDVPQHGTVLGDPSAPVTLTEYADLQCPICRDFSQNVLPQIVDRYVRNGKVKLDLQVVAILGPDSIKAQQFASGTTLQSKVWPFTHLFYENQGEENTGYVTDDFLNRIADATPGLDASKAAADQDSAPARALVAKADAADIQATPTFAIAKGNAAPKQVTFSSVDDLFAAIDAQTK